MAATVDVDRQSLLSREATAIVEATAAVVAEHADEITALFYPAMLTAHPDLLRLFNKGNQATGEQSRALAASAQWWPTPCNSSTRQPPPSST
jgi:hemoglobin-like flavoprotein